MGSLDYNDLVTSVWGTLFDVDAIYWFRNVLYKRAHFYFFLFRNLGGLTL